MSHSPYSELQSHLLATATRQRGRTHGRNTSRKTVGRELLDFTNYPPPLIGVSPLPPRSVTRTTRRDSRAAWAGTATPVLQTRTPTPATPTGAMYREWDQLPEGGTGLTSQLPPAASCPRGGDSGDLSEQLPGQGCHIPAHDCPFPISGVRD